MKIIKCLILLCLIGILSACKNNEFEINEFSGSDLLFISEMYSSIVIGADLDYFKSVSDGNTLVIDYDGTEYTINKLYFKVKAKENNNTDYYNEVFCVSNIDILNCDYIKGTREDYPLSTDELLNEFYIQDVYDYISGIDIAKLMSMLTNSDYSHVQITVQIQQFPNEENIQTLPESVYLYDVKNDDYISGEVAIKKLNIKMVLRDTITNEELICYFNL